MSQELQIFIAIATPVAAAAGAFGAVKVLLRWHWAEIQRAHARLDRLEARYT